MPWVWVLTELFSGLRFTTGARGRLDESSIVSLPGKTPAGESSFRTLAACWHTYPLIFSRTQRMEDERKTLKRVQPLMLVRWSFEAITPSLHNVKAESAYHNGKTWRNMLFSFCRRMVNLPNP